MDIIESSEDQDKSIIKNSIKYLDRMTNIKQLNIPTLKSLYRTKCRLMELRRHMYLPEQKPFQRCQQCFMNFLEGSTKYEIRPTKLSAFAKKLIAKANKGDIMTTYQRKYYQKLLKKHPNGFQGKNKLVLTCNYCKKETEVWMNKPKPKDLPGKNAKRPSKKRKKARKDKLCGLNENVVSLPSSAKKKKDTKSTDKISTNNNTASPLQTTNVFMEPKKCNFNTSVSLTNTRIFPSLPDSTLLKRNSKLRNNIVKTSRKRNKCPKPDLPKPPNSNLSSIVKGKEKLNKKRLDSLSNILKKVSENKSNKPVLKLKEFLSSL